MQSNKNLLQDMEFDAITFLKVPGGEIGNFNYSAIKLKIKNGEVLSTEMTPPNIKNIAFDEAKIMFMKSFYLEEVETVAKEQAKEYFEEKEKKKRGRPKKDEVIEITHGS